MKINAENRVYQNLQKNIYDNKYKPETNIFDRISLSFKVLGSLVYLKFSEFSFSQKMKTDSDIEVSSLFYSVLNPEILANDENEVNYMVNKVVNSQEFNFSNKFNDLKSCLSDPNEVEIHTITDEVLALLTSYKNLNPVVVKSLVIEKLEGIAENKFLVNPNELKTIKEGKKVYQLSFFLQNTMGNYILIPPLDIPLNLFSKEDLNDLKIFFETAIVNYSYDDVLKLKMIKDLEEVNTEIINNGTESNYIVTVPSQGFFISELKQNKKEEFKRYLEYAIQSRKPPEEQFALESYIHSLQSISDVNSKRSEIESTAFKLLRGIEPNRVDIGLLRYIPVTDSHSLQFYTALATHIIKSNQKIIEVSNNPYEIELAKLKINEIKILFESNLNLPACNYSYYHNKKIFDERAGDDVDSIKNNVEFSNYNYVTQSKNKKKLYLSVYEINEIKLFIRFNKYEPLTVEEKKRLGNFYLYALKNKDFNFRLSETKKNGIPFGIESSSIKFLRAWTYKSRNSEKFIEVNEKLKNIFYKFENNVEILDSEKLTLTDYGIFKESLVCENILSALNVGVALSEDSHPELMNLSAIPAGSLKA